MGRRSAEDIIRDAESLADRFEQWEPNADRALDGAPIREVHEAFQRAALGQRELIDAVRRARAAGFSWAYIGSVMGTSGEAARKRFGRAEAPGPSSAAGKRRRAG